MNKNTCTKKLNMNEQSTEQLKKDFDKTFPYLFSSCDGREGYDSEVTQDVWDFFLPHLISSDEIKRGAYKEIYKMGLSYQVQIAKMQLGEEESALILDDFLKDISDLTQSKEGGE